MKKLSKLLALVACVGFLFAGCDNPNMYDEKKDGDPNKEVTVNVTYSFVEKSGYYYTTDDVKDYSIVVKKDTTEVANEKVSKTETNLSYKSKGTGLYTVTMSANDANGKVIAIGTDSIIVKKTDTGTADIKLKIYPYSKAASDPITDPVTLNVYAFTDEVPGMIEKYCELHPEDNITINNKIAAFTDGQYMPVLDEALKDNTVDIYAAESAFLLRYSKGDMSDYAMPYEDLGIDIDYAVQAAKIAPYTIDLGSNKAGKINALWYQSTGGCFIYRRSIAKEVFGTDDPAEINEIIGGGTNSWDNFWKVAAKCAEKGVAVVSGDGDLWHAMESSADKGWVVDDKLYIDPKREKFLDFSKDLTDKGYSNQTTDWTKGWYDDMSGKGEKPVFGFFGPAWLINYTIARNCGGEAVGEGTYGDWAVCSSPVGFYWGGTGVLVNKNIDESKKKAVRKIIEWITLDTTKDGLLYKWASGTLYNENGTKDAVASGVVMAQTDGTMAFLGGQNMYDYFVPANQYATGKLLTELDGDINGFWRDQVRAYASGQKTREAAIADFKAIVFEVFGIASE